MLVSRTIKGRVEKPTAFKRRCLDHEYVGFQEWMLFGTNRGIYSTYKSAKGWKYTTINYRSYSLPLLARLTRFGRMETRTEIRWLLFRTALKKGIGIWLPIKLYQPIPDGWELQDSFLTYNARKGWYEVRLVYQKEIPTTRSYSHVITVDMGERVMATACGSWNRRPIFMGREIRGIRRHYAWLRKRLGERKLLRVIRRIGPREKHRVEAHLQEIAKRTVSLASTHEAVIALGDLHGIRAASTLKGRRIRRIIGGFTYYRLAVLVKQKAARLGIPVIEMDEHGTSKMCSRCGANGTRPSQGQFVCTRCEYKPNADHNGALNMLQKIERHAGYIPLCRAAASALKPVALANG